MNSLSRRHPRLRSNGFTLVELLVSITLLSMLMLGLVSAMGTLGTTADKVDARADRSSEFRLVSAFLREILSELPSSVRPVGAAGEARLYFNGTERDLVWLGNMPARHGLGGLHHMRMDLTGDGVLSLHYLPFVAADQAPQWSLASSHRLLEGVTDLRFSYERPATAAEPLLRWFDHWDATATLPGRVRVDLAVDGVRWAPLWIVVRSPELRNRVRIVHGPES